MDTYQKNLRDKWFFYDNDIAIFWDGDKTFQVQNDGKIVNQFKEKETVTTVKKAEEIAAKRGYFANQKEIEKSK